MRCYRSFFTIAATGSFFLAAILGTGCPSSTPGKKCGPPIVNAGDDLTGNVGETIILRGSLRLPPEDQQVCVSEKDSVTFLWEQNGGPDVTLDGAKSQVSFVPQQAGSYSFRCKANYPVTAINLSPQVSQWDTVKVEVANVACPSPVADAGDDQSLATMAGVAAAVTLDGSASHAATSAGCHEVSLSTYTWNKISEPAGSNVGITDADKVSATVELTEFGDYVFQLEVQDTGGIDDSRLNTASDTLTVTLAERSPCEDSLTVKVIAAVGGQAIAGAHVTVVDAGDGVHNQDTDASGEAAFSGLAVGTRKSITAATDDKVPALPGAPAGDRPKYETTTLLNHCSGEVTIPLMMTASGRSNHQTGIVTAKVPQSIFDMLPHSHKCAGSCSTNSDCDAPCNGTCFCEQEANECQGLCTPKSLLPFFSMGGSNVSGQMRVAIVIPMFALDNLSRFPVGKLFSRPPTDSAILPGNLASDDTFLNGLAPSLGLDPYGVSCDSIDMCPNEAGCNTLDCPDLHWTCDYDEHKCKDPTPLRNIRMELPEGQNRLVLLSGVMNVSMLDLLPVLLPFLDTNGSELNFDVGSMLAAFKLRTLHACPITVNIAAGQENEASATLAAITESDCWNVDYQQKEDVIPLADPGAIDPGNTCTTDQDCDPQSGYKCLADPDDPGSTYCFMPLYQVTIISNDETSLQPAATGFVPTTNGGDSRLQSLLPSTARHEVKCDENADGLPESCDPKVFCDVPITADDVECAFAFGLALTALDFAPGSQAVPEGGRAIIGFDFNRTPFAYQREPKFLVPPLDSPALSGASLNMTQLFLRNMVTRPDMSYELLPGRLGSSATSSSQVTVLQMPALLTPPVLDALPDAGMDITVHFVPNDALAGCASVTFDQIYALAQQMLAPAAGTHDFSTNLSEADLSTSAVRGIVLGKVDRVVDGDKEQILSDDWWRVYAPSGTTTFDLPAAASPFSSGSEIRVTLWGSQFRAPFDFDLFPVARLLAGQVSEVEDGWQLMVP
ncbi:MAG TPA: hypothetical protein VM425_21515 [Myxococcota bacterium]|nr:hypothetical protein [Myxococcota bacterium]